MVMVEKKIDALDEKSEITFSIVIPVYNMERYIEECLESVLKQVGVDYEVIVIDDGSTDSSGVICDEWQAKYPEILNVIHQRNEGTLLARMKGFALSRGSYIMTVDSDDMLMPDALSLINEVLKETRADVIRYGYTKDIDEYNKCVKDSSRIYNIKYYETLDKRTYLQSLCEGVYHNAMWSKAVRRNCSAIDVDYSKYIGMTYAEDFLQTLEIYDRSEIFCEVDCPLYYYRPNPQSCTGGRKYNPTHYVQRIAALDAAWPFAERWEAVYNLDGCTVGLASQGLSEASKYAVFLAQSGRFAELRDLRVSEGFQLRYSVGGASKCLKLNERLEAWLLFRGAFRTLRVEAILKNAVNSFRGR